MKYSSINLLQVKEALRAGKAVYSMTRIDQSTPLGVLLDATHLVAEEDEVIIPEEYEDEEEIPEEPDTVEEEPEEPEETKDLYDLEEVDQVEEEPEEKPEEEPEEEPEAEPEPIKKEKLYRGRELDKDKVFALYKAGWRVKDIAEEMHCEQRTISNCLYLARKKGINV